MYLTELHINVQKVTLSILLGVCIAKFLEHASIFIHVCGDEGFWSLGLLYPGVVGGQYMCGQTSVPTSSPHVQLFWLEIINNRPSDAPELFPLSRSLPTLYL